MLVQMIEADAQRIWFPEMIDHLRERWQQSMAFDALVQLRDDLEVMLQKIRTERQIGTAVVRCGQCGRVHAAPEPRVTVRSMILSLLRFEIAAAEQTHTLEKEWAVYRKQNDLGIYGKRGEETPALGCARRKR
jgi:hypothetical protein